MAIRRLDEQFGPDTVKRINKLIERLDNLRYPRGVSSYYAKDLQVCLEAGALLSSLHLVVTLSEVIVRSLVIIYAMEVSGPRIKEDQPTVERVLEERRAVYLPTLLDWLIESDFFDGEDAEKLISIYKKVRTPILHGLPGRFIQPEDPEDPFNKVRQYLRWPGPTSVRDFEKKIESESIQTIDLLIGIFERNLK